MLFHSYEVGLFVAHLFFFFCIHENFFRLGVHRDSSETLPNQINSLGVSWTPASITPENTPTTGNSGPQLNNGRAKQRGVGEQRGEILSKFYSAFN
jgi:hypothetical protein